jgi:hypothetical protein
MTTMGSPSPIHTPFPKLFKYGQWKNPFDEDEEQQVEKLGFCQLNILLRGHGIV